jgi:hypothetical protein
MDQKKLDLRVEDLGKDGAYEPEAPPRRQRSSARTIFLRGALLLAILLGLRVVHWKVLLDNPLFPHPHPGGPQACRSPAQWRPPLPRQTPAAPEYDRARGALPVRPARRSRALTFTFHPQVSPESRGRVTNHDGVHCPSARRGLSAGRFRCRADARIFPRGTADPEAV